MLAHVRIPPSSPAAPHPTADIAADHLLRPEVRLLTLMGVGGVGKTQLALQLAADLLDAYPDGVSFVNLAPLSDPNIVAVPIAQTLGEQESGSQPPSRV